MILNACILCIFVCVSITGRLETHIEELDYCQILAKQCQLDKLQEQIHEKFKKTLSFRKDLYRFSLRLC